MFNKALNFLFQLQVRSSKKAANAIVDEYVSRVGVQNFLQNKLKENTQSRLNAFEGIVKQNLATNNLDKAIANLEAAYKSGQM